MARDTASYTPLQILAGDTDLRSKFVVIPANQAAIPALTPLKRDANFKCVPATLITDEIVGIVVPGVGSEPGALVGTTLSAADQTISVYTQGDFWADQVNFTSIPLAVSDATKDAVFDATGITVKFHDYVMPTP
jgi:hypothetical protein